MTPFAHTKPRRGFIKFSFSLLVFFTLKSAFASVQEASPYMSEIVKKTVKSEKYCPTFADGEVCLMTWYDAVAFCKGQNSHLPTAREYANLTVSRGAKLLEITEVKDVPPQGFYLVSSRNPDSSFDSFYLNHTSYVRPSDEVDNHLLWTSSIPPKHPQYAHVYYDQWGGGGGDPKEHLLNHLNSVRCIAEQ